VQETAPPGGKGKRTAIGHAARKRERYVLLRALHRQCLELSDLTLLVVAINGWNRYAIAFRKMPA
jgi:hypothetical protein